MKKGFVLLMVMIFGLVLVTGVIAREKGAKPWGAKQRSLKIEATVEAIDLDKRIITLKGPKGNVVDLTVGKRVRNLSKLKVGDLVNVSYYEAVVFRVHAPGEAGELTTDAGASLPGERTAGVAFTQVTVTATVEALDTETQHVTLKGDEGKTFVLKVKDPKYLENVKVGDRATFFYTRGVAVSVKPAKKL